VRDKIACAQFIAALSDGFLKRTLQLENITSLKTAVERAMAVKVIQENSFSKNKFNQNDNNNKYNKFNKFNKQKNEENIKNEEEGNKKKFVNNKNNRFQRNKFNHQKKECWQCGAERHFRSECPSLTENKG